ncbi:Peptidase C19 ubiquitin carboxyl-terminal hydrolase [Trinorchestia longiramus]|nr:Peptidase C19 ubiquitin carboxyl-terminal hydrolase [Trinorchestia longiramus]
MHSRTLRSRTECRPCKHANAAVNSAQIRKNTKPPVRIGECSGCAKALRQQQQDEKFTSDNKKVKSGTNVSVVWLCLFCGHQGCDRDTVGHALQHYRTPRSDKHCLVLSTRHWTVWCYECDCEVLQKNCKKLYETVQYVKRRYDFAPPQEVVTKATPAADDTLSPLATGRSRSAVRSLSPSALASRQRGSSATLLDDKSRKEQLAALPKVKGITNLGNTCFFNSVMQVLGQTHALTQLFDLQLQTGQRTSLPGHPAESSDRRHINRRRGKSLDLDMDDRDEELELKPLDLMLPEGGSLSLALASFLKEMHAVGRNSILSPGHLFGQIRGSDVPQLQRVCKKSSQFGGFEQQDAHELLRCLLESIRAEELHRAKRAILKAFALNEKTDPSKVAPHIRRIIQGYGRQATHTIIDQIFGGQLISTVVCEECKWSSQVFEPFMDLSLSLSEDKGKPRNVGGNDECVFDCFGRTVSTNSKVNSSVQSKHQLKKQKKLSKKNRNSKNFNKGKVGSGNKINKNTNSNITSCIVPPESLSEQVQKRLTEKSRPEDEEYKKQQKEEALRLAQERVPVNGVPSIVVGDASSGGGNESSKYKVLMQARNARRREEMQNNCSSEEEEDEEGEELEYDHDDDLEDDGRLNKKKSCSTRSLNRLGLSDTEGSQNTALINKNILLNRLQSLAASGAKGSVKVNGTKDSDEDDDDENDDDDGDDSDDEDDDDDNDDDDDDDEEEDDDEEDEEDESDSEQRNGESDAAAKKKENSDADEEDNAESEIPQDRIMTRQPSIVVVEQTELCDGGGGGGIASDGRYLSTSASYDQLNYNSASDTSERYYTCDGNGVDTGDDLDTPKRHSLSKETLLKASTDEELARKLCELKLHRKSSSKESLHRSSYNKRPSGETLSSFRSCDRLTEEDDQWLSTKVNPRKFKQEWLSRSLTTLAPKYQARAQECSVMSCLAKFTAPELLASTNKIICQNCTKIRNISGNNPDVDGPVRSAAMKQLMIVCPPAVLTLQLKRFHHDGVHLAKANRFVHFPLVLDLAPFTSTIALPPGTRILYGLYGIVQHTGRLHNGHYTAYVRSRPMVSTRPPPTAYLAQQPLDSSRLETDPPPMLPPLKPQQSSPTLEELVAEVRKDQWYHVSDAHVTHVTIDRVLKAQAYLLFYERIV